MEKILHLDQIKEALKKIDPVDLIGEGFVAYSQGKAVIPPVGELIFENPPGEVHIKYGYLKGDDYYVIKIASGFHESQELGRYKSDGLMLLFKQGTGELACALLDECHLTNVRTAAAGAVAAKYLAPKDVHGIGILGAGVQGRMQLEYLAPVVGCRDVFVWGLNKNELDEYKKDMEPHGFNIKTTLNTGDIASHCNLIVTATPSQTPLLKAEQVKEGVHITAVGADTPAKNELDPKILQKADMVVADSISQCRLRGEIHHALKAGLLKEETVVELGTVITNKGLQRSFEGQITIADLTGVAVQDLQISKAVYNSIV